MTSSDHLEKYSPLPLAKQHGTQIVGKQQTRCLDGINEYYIQIRTIWQLKLKKKSVVTEILAQIYHSS